MVATVDLNRAQYYFKPLSAPLLGRGVKVSSAHLAGNGNAVVKPPIADDTIVRYTLDLESLRSRGYSILHCIKSCHIERP